MLPSPFEKVRTVFRGIAHGDLELAVQHIDPEQYIEHDPYTRGGAERLKKDHGGSSSKNRSLEVLRAFQDGEFVITHARKGIPGGDVLFDVFRFEHGLIVEHWAFSSPEGLPN